MLRENEKIPILQKIAKSGHIYARNFGASEVL